MSEGNERIAVVETRLDSLDDKVSGISGMERAIERLNTNTQNLEKRIIENQEESDKKFDKIADSLEKLVVTSTELKSLRVCSAEMKEKMDNVTKLAASNESRIAKLEQRQMAELDFKKEKMKSRYAFWGAIAVAALSLIGSILALVLK